MSGKRMSVQEVMSVVDRDSLFYANSDGGVTFGGGEPTAAGDFLVELLQHCASKGYRRLCGYLRDVRTRTVSESASPDRSFSLRL